MADTVRIPIEASIGIAVAPADATDPAGLLWCADIAMYRAKLTGAPFATYQPDLDKTANRMLLLHPDCVLAIEERQLVLHYQPQLDLRTGEIIAVESLIRWAHPRLGIVPPAEFLPLAEESGLMGPITSCAHRFSRPVRCLAPRRPAPVGLREYFTGEPARPRVYHARPRPSRQSPGARRSPRPGDHRDHRHHSL